MAGASGFPRFQCLVDRDLLLLGVGEGLILEAPQAHGLTSAGALGRPLLLQHPRGAEGQRAPDTQSLLGTPPGQ